MEKALSDLNQIGCFDKWEDSFPCKVIHLLMDQKFQYKAVDLHTRIYFCTSYERYNVQEKLNVHVDVSSLVTK